MTIDEFIERNEKWGKTYPKLELGVWDIYGEDANADLAGVHSTPFLARVEGSYWRAVEFALKLPRFFTWGGGGEVKKYEPASAIQIIKLEGNP